MFVTLTPAYGRDYKSAKAVKTDWVDEKDFVIADLFHPDSGRYINRQQTTSKDTFNVRYNKKQKVVVIKGGK